MTDEQMEEFLDGKFTLEEFFEKRDEWRKFNFSRETKLDLFSEINFNQPKSS